MSLETRREARSLKQKQCLGMLSILDLVRLCAAFGHPRRPLPCRRHCSHGQICRRERWEPGAASHCCLAMLADEYSRASLSHLVSACSHSHSHSTLTLTLVFTSTPLPSHSHSPSLALSTALTPWQTSDMPAMRLTRKLAERRHLFSESGAGKLPSQLNLSASFSSEP